MKGTYKLLEWLYAEYRICGHFLMCVIRPQREAASCTKKGPAAVNSTHAANLNVRTASIIIIIVVVIVIVILSSSLSYCNILID